MGVLQRSLEELLTFVRQTIDPLPSNVFFVIEKKHQVTLLLLKQHRRYLNQDDSFVKKATSER